MICATDPNVLQFPPQPFNIGLTASAAPITKFAQSVADRIRAKVIATTDVRLVPAGLPSRTDYKSKLVDWSQTK
jgi:phenylacetate-CoA ligase